MQSEPPCGSLACYVPYLYACLFQVAGHLRPDVGMSPYVLIFLSWLNLELEEARRFFHRTKIASTLARVPVLPCRVLFSIFPFRFSALIPFSPCVFFSTVGGCRCAVSQATNASSDLIKRILPTSLLHHCLIVISHRFHLYSLPSPSWRGQL